MNQQNQTRRNFLKTVALGTTVFTVVPRHVLGGSGYLAPSDEQIGRASCRERV